MFNAILFTLILFSSFNTYADTESAATYKAIADKYKTQAIYYSKKAGMYNPTLYGIESLTLPPPPPYNPWKGTQIGLGAGSTTGNSNTLNAQGNLLANYKPQKGDIGWIFNTIGQYNYLTSSDEGLQKNRLYLQQTGSYMFNKYNGMFGQISYLNDALDGYYYTFNENIGYQLEVFENKYMNLILSMGPGTQQRQEVGNTTTEVIPTWLTQFTYNLNINETLSFKEQLQNIATQGNTSTNSISALTLQTYKNLGISLNYQITYNSIPPNGKAGLVSISGINFVYSIN